MRHALGDRVSHPVFGTGSIYRVGQRGKLLVSFVGLPHAPHDRMLWLDARTVLTMEDNIIEQSVREEIRTRPAAAKAKIIGFAWLSPHDLFIPAHQRSNLDQKIIDKILREGWNQRLSPTLMIAYRDGRNNTYQGRHRLIAMLRLMELGRLPADFKVPCIIEPMTEAEELEARGLEEWRGEYEAATFNKRAVVKGLTENRIYELGKAYQFFPEQFVQASEVPNAYRYSCYKALRNIYLGKTMEGEYYTGVLSPSDGPAVLSVIMSIHKKVWGQNRDRILDRTSVNALKIILENFGIASPPHLAFSTTGTLDALRLIDVLSQKSLREWKEEVNRAKGGGDNLSVVMAKLIIEGKKYSPTANLKLWYNRGIPGPRRLKV